ncbi:uncharacterized protein [Montipora capricornis]|uniref:uncharacterized protein isoform X2 n=1 Tax=Montipora capricornis TaxID=246305 RepID=UPI0035F1705A
MFKRKKVIATYSKSQPVQITKGKLFLTPDTPEDSWIPYSKGKTLKQGTKGKASWMTSSRRQGVSLALRNISNIPLEKTLSRTPCAQSQEARHTKNKVLSVDNLPHEASSTDSKECSARHLKRGSSKKSKVLISKTTYSSKSMSSCSVCGNTPCSTNHVLSTIKSMSLCLSSLDNDLPDGSLDDVPDNNSQLSKPHNSTFLSEDLNISLKDLVPEDLSPIMGEFLMVGSAPTLPRCSTPVDSRKLYNLAALEPTVSPIQPSCKTVVPEKLSKSADKVKDSTEQAMPNITPETIPSKECITAEKPKQKRKLAYSLDSHNIPECVLLHEVNNGKKPFKLMFKQDIISCDNHWSNLPVDILIELP